MNASSAVVTAQSRGRVKLHTVVVYRMVVQMAVGAAVPTDAVVGHMVRTVVAVRMVLLTVDSRGAVAVHPVMAGAPSDHCSWEITSFLA